MFHESSTVHGQAVSGRSMKLYGGDEVEDCVYPGHSHTGVRGSRSSSSATLEGRMKYRYSLHPKLPLLPLAAL